MSGRDFADDADIPARRRLMITLDDGRDAGRHDKRVAEDDARRPFYIEDYISCRRCDSAGSMAEKTSITQPRWDRIHELHINISKILFRGFSPWPLGRRVMLAWLPARQRYRPFRDTGAGLAQEGITNRARAGGRGSAAERQQQRRHTPQASIVPAAERSG